MLVGLPSQTAPQQGVAHSKFAERADIEGENGITEAAEPKANQGIYLGRFVGAGREPDGKAPQRLRYKGKKHVMVFGPTRSGKSAAIITANLQNLRRSIIVTDPKGELAAITAARRGAPDFGKTIILNPFGVLVERYPHLKSAGWQPLLQLDQQSKDFAGDALCIADAIVEKSKGGGNNDYFDRQALNLAQALIMWERMNKGRNASLRNIPKMLSGKGEDGSFKATLEKMAKCKNDVVETIAARMLDRLNDKNSQTTDVQNVIETVMSHFGLINEEFIAADAERQLRWPLIDN